MGKVRVNRRELDRLKRRLKAAGSRAVKVGVLGSEGSDQVLVAAVNEFGTETVPERSFLRSTMNANRAKYVKGLERAAQHIVEGTLDADRALGLVGLEVVKDVQTTITTLRDPPNAQATVERKGSSNPLIDTGRLRQSISFDVVAVKPEDRKK